MIRLNLGCGEDYREGWINIDRDPRVKADIHMDVVADGIPCDDGSADYILASHLLEHVFDLKGFQRNLWTALKPGGSLEIITPDYLSPDAWGDPEHCRAFSMQSFMCGFWPGFEVQSANYRFELKVKTNEECRWIHVLMIKEDKNGNR